MTYPLWQISCDEKGERLLLEQREQSSFQTHFTLLDLNSLQLQALPLPGEEWWLSAVGIDGPQVLFQKYDDSANPDHKEYVIYHLDKSALLPPLRESESLPEPLKIILSNIEQAKNKHLNLPFLYIKDSSYFNTVSNFLRQRLNILAVEGIEYLETNQWILISYYEQEDQLTNRFIILDRQGQLVFEDTLAKNLTGLGTSTFMVSHNKLIFVKNKTDFFIYRLS